MPMLVLSSAGVPIRDYGRAEVDESFVYSHYFINKLLILYITYLTDTHNEHEQTNLHGFSCNNLSIVVY